jgi:hypothetical protein
LRTAVPGHSLFDLIGSIFERLHARLLHTQHDHPASLSHGKSSGHVS